jgi:hypothetical protein
MLDRKKASQICLFHCYRHYWCLIYCVLRAPLPLQAASAIAGVLEQLLLYYVRADHFPLHPETVTYA